MTRTTSPDNRIRIALVITELNVGGAERCLTQLAAGLDRKRYDPLVISIAPRPTADQAELVERLEAAQIPVCFLNASSKWLVLIAAQRLRKTLADFSPHIVQSFLFHADVLVRLAGRRQPWQTMLGLRVADPSPRRQRLQRWAARPATKVVCVSQAVRDYAQQEVCIAAEKLVVIPNSVDVAKYKNASPPKLTSLGIDSSRQIILYVGRLHPQKGLDWLLSTMPTVFEQLPDHDLILVGSGPDERRLRSQAARFEIANRVHFVGWRADVAQLLAASSLLVLSSRWEGMPNVVLEAMASGLPVVATNTHGVRELLGVNHEAQTVDFGDTDALTVRLVALGRDPQRAKHIGLENQRRVAVQFSVQGMIAAYQALYESAAQVETSTRR